MSKPEQSDQKLNTAEEDTRCSEKIESDIEDLEFSIHKSLRYLTKRKGFFDSLHHLSVVTTMISSTIVFATLFANYQTASKWIMFLIILISTIDISVGFSKKVDLYDNLQRRFTSLLIDITVKSHTEDNLKKWEIERLLIEQDEPPVLKVLDLICHNEQAIAQGDNDNIYKVSRLQSFLRHFWSFDNWRPHE